MKKISVSLVRLLVGVVFIISGFVKLVDPIGFSFKLEEYFEPHVLDMPFFIPYAYPIAIFVVAFELILGVLLLLGYLRNFTLLSLLGLTIFFGFLTFYSAYYNKVTDCGCFGDALKFTPWGSFTKDMVLLVLAAALWYARGYISPLFSPQKCLTILVITVLACMGLVLLDLGVLSMIALILNYAFEAIMFPTIFSLSLRGLGNLTKSASSLLMMTPIGGCGFLLMGVIADSTQIMTLPFIIPFLGYFTILIFASELTRKRKNNTVTI